MNLPLYIAKRYLFARKSHQVINIISAISAIGMAIGTAALVLILSVYNGFDKIIEDNISDLDPDILVTPAAGKTFLPEGEAIDWVLGHPEIASVSSVIEDNVLLSYEANQVIARAKGVDEVYEEESALRDHLAEGEFSLRRGDLSLGSFGSGVAHTLGVHPRFVDPVTLYYPDRNAPVSAANPAASLRSAKVLTGSIFSISSTADNELVIVPIETMRSLLDCGGEISALELRTDGKASHRLIGEIAARFGPDFKVLDRYRQHPSLYKMMRYEKAAIFLILLFVVIIVAFNIFGSLSMLIIEKREDCGTLQALGASDKLIRRIFLLEGWLTALIGALAGVVAGVLLALGQQRFGWIKMPGGFQMEAYPVILKAPDVLITALSVALIGLLISALALGTLRSPADSRSLQE